MSEPARKIREILNDAHLRNGMKRGTLELLRAAWRHEMDDDPHLAKKTPPLPDPNEPTEPE